MLRRVYQLLLGKGVREVLHAGARFLRAAVKRALYRGAARLRYWKYISWYGESVAEPYELIHINPSDVERRVYPYFEEGLSEYGTYIVGGNWTGDTKTIHSATPWRNTAW